MPFMSADMMLKPMKISRGNKMKIEEVEKIVKGSADFNFSEKTVERQGKTEIHINHNVLIDIEGRYKLVAENEHRTKWTLYKYNSDSQKFEKKDSILGVNLKKTVASLERDIQKYRIAKALWHELEDVPMNPETECIEVDWHGFKAGTNKEEIWNWLEYNFNISVANDLMYEEDIENSDKFWFLEQSNHGHIYRYVYTDKELKQELEKYNLLDFLEDKQCADIGFPIGGSNSSSTYFIECKTEKEVVEWLESAVEVDYDDPMLVDLSEGIMDIELNEGCAKYFVDKYNIDTQTRWDSRYDECNKMIQELKSLGYEYFDYDDAFYGDNSDMTYYELYTLYHEEWFRDMLDTVNPGNNGDWEEHIVAGLKEEWLETLIPIFKELFDNETKAFWVSSWEKGKDDNCMLTFTTIKDYDNVALKTIEQKIIDRYYYKNEDNYHKDIVTYEIAGSNNIWRKFDKDKCSLVSVYIEQYDSETEGSEKYEYYNTEVLVRDDLTGLTFDLGNGGYTYYEDVKSLLEDIEFVKKANDFMTNETTKECINWVKHPEDWYIKEIEEIER